MPSRSKPTRTLCELLIKKMFLGDSAPNERVKVKMRAHRISLATAALLLVLTASACSASSSQSGSSQQSSKPIHSEHLSTLSAEDIEPTNFDNSTSVDNKWFPLVPGEHSVFEGSSLDGGQRISRRVVSTVTDLSKVIYDVNTIVVLERDYSEGQEVEAELAFFAKDNYGNVWHMGEYPEEYENGEFDKAPGWLAGSKGAKAGIAMKAQPRLGTPSYAQGYAPPPINWVDRGRVYKVGQKTCMPVDCYDEVLVIEEFERNKPGAYQLKYYAPGVGDIRVGWRWPEEEEKEGLDLVKEKRLSPQDLAKARAKALQLEKHAYQIKEYYRKTQPAKPTL
jgi:hypothetical protein